MIGVAPDLAPSSVLYWGQIPEVIQSLLEESRDSRQRQRWTRAERSGQEACDLCREARDHVGVAIAQIHLADLYGDVGELGQALAVCGEAYRALSRQPTRMQSHNAGVAAYGLGILYALQLRGAIDALKWYQEALRHFADAQELWATLNVAPLIRSCQRLCQEIEQRTQRIMATRHRGQDSPQAVFTIWQFDSLGAPFTKPGDQQGLVIGDERVLIDGKPYRPQPPIDTDEENYCFALPVPHRAWPLPEAQAGDYVFARQQWDVDEANEGIVWERGSGWVAVGFERRADGQIRIFPLNPKFVEGAAGMTGDPDRRLKAYIIGLLKPEK